MARHCAEETQDHTTFQDWHTEEEGTRMLPSRPISTVIFCNCISDEGHPEGPCLSFAGCESLSEAREDVREIESPRVIR